MMFRKSAEIKKQPEPVRLKNGTEVAAETLAMVKISLKTLLATDPITLIELLRKCQNPNHDMFGGTKDKAESLNLTSGGVVHEDIKNIVLSSVRQVNKFEIAIDDPVERPSFRPPF